MALQIMHLQIMQKTAETVSSYTKLHNERLEAANPDA